MEKIKIKLTPNKLAAVNAIIAYTLKHSIPNDNKPVKAYVSILESIYERLAKKEITKPKKEFSISFQYYELHGLEVCVRSVLVGKIEDQYLYTLIKNVADDINQKLA